MSMDDFCRGRLVLSQWWWKTVSLLFQQIIVHGRLEICLVLKILPISYRRGFSSGPCESGEKRVRMCSCLSGSSWNLQLLRNGSKTSFQLVLITILLRAALCSLDIYQLVNGLMLFYSERVHNLPHSHHFFLSSFYATFANIHTPKYGYLAQGYTACRLQQTGRTTSLSIGRRPALLPELLPLLVVILFINPKSWFCFNFDVFTGIHVSSLIRVMTSVRLKF